MTPTIKVHIIALCCLSIAGYSQKFKIFKESDWVKQREIPASSPVTKRDIKSGYYFTLADYQWNLDENCTYSHEVCKVSAYSGITKASQLMVTFDSSYQKLRIHHLYVWRNGIKNDRTQSLSFEIMNNEDKLQNGLYMGRITAYDNLSDIRKDDLIDFAYTIAGKNPIFKDGKYLLLPLESDNPIDQYTYRIIYSKEKKYNYKCVDCDSAIKVSEVVTPGKYKEVEIVMKNVKASEFEANIPTWKIPYKYFTLSSYKSWNEVNTWAQGVFTLSPLPDLSGVTKEIFNGKETQEEKIEKIINFVQDDIRYMGIESGIGSIKPFSPEVVVKRRFGDCKDKSLLLVTLLKSIGIKEAYPVLVNTGMQNALDQLYPSSQIFNHCIVTFKIDSLSYWTDPTITQQGGTYKTSSLPDYGQALVVGQASGTLTKIPDLNKKSAIRVKDELTMKSFTEPAILDMRSTRYGAQADMRRISLEHYSAAEIHKGISADLQSTFPVVNQAADMVVKDDSISNIITNTYQYEVDGFWQDGDKMKDKRLEGLWIFRFEPKNVNDYLSMFNGADRRFDYALPYPFIYNYRIIFHLPGDILIDDKYVKHENSAFFFDEKTEQLSSNSFQVTYNFSTKTSYIPAADFKNVSKEKNKITESSAIVIYFPK